MRCTEATFARKESGSAEGDTLTAVTLINKCKQDHALVEGFCLVHIQTECQKNVNFVILLAFDSIESAISYRNEKTIERWDHRSHLARPSTNCFQARDTSHSINVNTRAKKVSNHSTGGEVSKSRISLGQCHTVLDSPSHC